MAMSVENNQPRQKSSWKNKESFTQQLARKLYRRNRGSLALALKFKLTNFAGSILDNSNKKPLKGGRYAILSYIPQAGAGVEVGVWRGDFSQALLNHLKPRQLTLIDPWAHQQDADELHQKVCQRFSANDNVKVVRSTSLEAAKAIADQSLDWVYIDGSHFYKDVLDDLNAWRPKLRNNGILFGDDYYWRDTESEYTVKKAVDEFIATVKPKSWVVFRGQFLIRFE